MGTFGIRQDEIAISSLLKHLFDSKKSGNLVMATGYFNLTDDLESIILNLPIPCRLLCASPEANGFYGAKGIAGYVPDAYSHILTTFMKSVKKAGRKYQIVPWMYDRPDWTFHAKGMWLYNSNGDKGPMITTIGSPNYGYRSVQRDLESEVVVVTSNEELQQKLQTEVEDLFRFTREVNEDPVVVWVPWILPFIRSQL